MERSTRETSRRRIDLAFIMALVMMTLANVCGGRAKAQAPVPAAVATPVAAPHAQQTTLDVSTVTPAELYGARLCVNEVSFALHVSDCLAILHIQRRNARAQGVSIEEYILRYHADVVTVEGRRVAYTNSPGCRRRHRCEDRRPWIAELSADGAQPPSYTGDWERDRVRWGQYLAWAASVFRPEDDRAARRTDPCRGQAHVWGGRVDQHHIERHVAAGNTIIDCGATLQQYIRFGS